MRKRREKRRQNKEHESVWKYVFTNTALKNRVSAQKCYFSCVKVKLFWSWNLFYLFIIYNDNTNNSLLITYYESGIVLISF